MSEDFNNQSQVSVDGISSGLKTNDEVDAIVRAKIARTTEKITRELEEKHRAEIERLSSTAKSIDVDDIIAKAKDAAKRELNNDIQRLQAEHAEKAKKMAEEKQQQEQQANIARQADQYFKHVKDVSYDASVHKVDIFTGSTDDSKADLEEFAPLLLMVGDLDIEGTSEIMSELAKKPKKLRELNRDAKENNKRAVFSELKELASQIKEKRSPAVRSVAREPVTPLKPSTVGSSSGSVYTVADYKRDPRLRR